MRHPSRQQTCRTTPLCPSASVHDSHHSVFSGSTGSPPHAIATARTPRLKQVPAVPFRLVGVAAPQTDEGRPAPPPRQRLTKASWATPFHRLISRIVTATATYQITNSVMCCAPLPQAAAEYGLLERRQIPRGEDGEEVVIETLQQHRIDWHRLGNNIAVSPKLGLCRRC